MAVFETVKVIVDDDLGFCVGIWKVACLMHGRKKKRRRKLSAESSWSGI